jgi:hypothetical protein
MSEQMFDGTDSTRQSSILCLVSGVVASLIAVLGRRFRLGRETA